MFTSYPVKGDMILRRNRRFKCNLNVQTFKLGGIKIFELVAEECIQN